MKILRAVLAGKTTRPQWDVLPHFLSHTFAHVQNGSQLRILPRSLILQSVMVRPHSWAPGVQTHRTYGSMGLWLMAIHLFKARKREFEPTSLNLNQNHFSFTFFSFALRASSEIQTQGAAHVDQVHRGSPNKNTW